MSAVRDEPATVTPLAAARREVAPVESQNGAAHAVAPTVVPTPPGTALASVISTRVITYLSHQAHYVGRAGIIGVALLIFSLICFLSANSPLHGQLTQLRADLASAQQTQTARSRAGLDLTPRVQLQTLIAKLPARAELPAITERIIAQADSAGLALERGSYGVDVVQSGAIARARIVFPVHGSYPNIRSFVDGTLSAVPGAAVDGLRLERKEIGASEVDAEVRFAVYLRNSP
ncbi:MAG: type 4a pilus biogenesis protein PilO [Steroidobacteraceae bacterium]